MAMRYKTSYNSIAWMESPKYTIKSNHSLNTDQQISPKKIQG